MLRVLQLLLISLLLGIGNTHAGEQERRVIVGLKLFPTLLAADKDIRTKLGADGRLLLILLYKDDKAYAEELAERLRKIEKIRGKPIRVESLPLSSLAVVESISPAGVFLTQLINGDIEQIVGLSKSKGIIVFSPFKGDVERGILGGVFIGDRILPHINITTLNASGIRIKPFFMEVAKQHE